MEPFKMRTDWGRRHGWELQRLLLPSGIFWRVTGSDGSCRPASPHEIALWISMRRKRKG